MIYLLVVPLNRNHSSISETAIHTPSLAATDSRFTVTCRPRMLCLGVELVIPTKNHHKSGNLHSQICRQCADWGKRLHHCHSSRQSDDERPASTCECWRDSTRFCWASNWLLRQRTNTNPGISTHISAANVPIEASIFIIVTRHDNPAMDDHRRHVNVEEIRIDFAGCRIVHSNNYHNHSKILQCRWLMCRMPHTLPFSECCMAKAMVVKTSTGLPSE